MKNRYHLFLRNLALAGVLLVVASPTLLRMVISNYHLTGGLMIGGLIWMATAMVLGLDEAERTERKKARIFPRQTKEFSLIPNWMILLFLVIFAILMINGMKELHGKGLFFVVASAMEIPVLLRILLYRI